MEKLDDITDRVRSHSVGYQGPSTDASTPSSSMNTQMPIASVDRSRSMSTGRLGDVPLSSRLETLRSRLSAAASGPTQLWLFLLELLLLDPDQKCIRWTGRGWEFLMGTIH